MEALYFRAIQRSVFGIIRCRVEGPNVACRLFGRGLALAFHTPMTVEEGRVVTRSWTIGQGFLARRADSFGSLLLGAEFPASEKDGAEWHLWAEVQNYPSRFLPQSEKSHLLRLILARGYVAIHDWVTLRYLKQLAALLRQGGIQ